MEEANSMERTESGGPHDVPQGATTCRFPESRKPRSQAKEVISRGVVLKIS